MEEIPYGVIYCLTCKVNGKVYIGQTTDFKERIRKYKTLQCKGQRQLYNALKKHGVDNFLYEIIDTGLSQEDLTQLEDYNMVLSNSRNKLHGYNTRKAGNKGKHSEESRKKMSESGKIKIFSEQHKINLSLSLKGIKRSPLSEDTKKKIAKAQTGRKHSEEHRMKNSIGHMGNPSRTGMKNSPETRQKMRESAKRKPPITEQARENMRIAQKKSWIKRKQESSEAYISLQ